MFFLNFTKNFMEENISQSVSEEQIEKQDNTLDRVDINVLKSRIRVEENKILRRNIFIFSACLIVIVIAGVYVTYL
jgi:hypothetical protein